MEVLKEIEDELLKKFPKLSCQIHESQFLHVWKLSSQGLRYIPNFHLIFESNEDKDFVVKLLSFHGKLLDCVVFKVTENGALPQNVENFVYDYTKDLKICQGVRYDCLDTNVKLVEHFNEEVVARSFQCLYYLQTTELEFQCPECKKLNYADGLPFDIKQENHGFNLQEDFNDTFDDSMEDHVEIIRTEKPSKRRKSRKNLSYQDFQDLDEPLLNELDLEPNNLEIKFEVGDYSVKEEHIEGLDTPYVGHEDPEQPKPKRKYRKRKKKGDIESNDSLKIDPVTIKNTLKKIKGENDYQETCQICLKVFCSRQTFEEDLLKHRGYFDIDGIVQCPICSESHPKLSLNLHFTQCHSTPADPKHVCVVCMEVIPGNKITNLRKHLNQHCLTKPHCPDCGKEMGSTRYLILHVELVHGKSCKEGMICCDRCGKVNSSYIRISIPTLQ